MDEEWATWMEDHEAALVALRKKVNGIVGKYEKEAMRLNQRLEQELRPFRKPLAELQKEVTEAGEEFDALLPERPGQEPTAPEESAWLFDSSRSYVEQLAFYPSHPARKRGAR
jgi:hypothetical protein